MARISGRRALGTVYLTLEYPGSTMSQQSRAREQFVGEPIKPDISTFDANRMAIGEPGLPQEFTWQGNIIQVKAVRTATTWPSARSLAGLGRLRAGGTMTVDSKWRCKVRRVAASGDDLHWWDDQRTDD